MKRNKKNKKCPRCGSVVFDNAFICSGCVMVKEYYGGVKNG